MTDRLCACGCGLPTTQSAYTDLRRGVRAGQPLTFIHGHNGRIPLSEPPIRLCACGCGQATQIAERTSKKRQTERGGRLKYVHGHNRRTMTLAERLWSRVVKGDGDSCWLWTGATHEFGYGVITDRSSKRHVRAHRLSWELANGPIAGDLLVLHKCDNPRCVRPDHLFLGDHADNTTDKVSKGRQRRGSSHPATTLTEAQALEIARSPKTTAARRELVRRFGVRPATVLGIQMGRIWKHLQLQGGAL